MTHTHQLQHSFLFKVLSISGWISTQLAVFQQSVFQQLERVLLQGFYSLLKCTTCVCVRRVARNFDCGANNSQVSTFKYIYAPCFQSTIHKMFFLAFLFLNNSVQI